MVCLELKMNLSDRKFFKSELIGGFSGYNDLEIYSIGDHGKIRA